MTAQTPTPRTDCLENLSSPPPLILTLERVIVKDISEMKNQRPLPFGNLVRLFISKISPARKNHLSQILLQYQPLYRLRVEILLLGKSHHVSSAHVRINPRWRGSFHMW